MSRSDDVATIVALAALGDHVVTRTGLLAAGLGRQEIARHIGSGLLTAALPGVYLVATDKLSQRQLFRVAIGYSGPVSALSAYSAGEQRGVVRPFFGRVSVATGRRGLKQRRVEPAVPMTNDQPGHIVFEPTTDHRFTEFDGLPVVSVARMLIEIAARGGRRAAERAWKQADFHRQLDLAELQAELRLTHRRGAPILRSLIDTLPSPVDRALDIRSGEEISFIHILAAAGFETPEVNVPMTIGGEDYVADFFYRYLRLVIEVDDPSHRQPVAAGRDRIRDVEFLAAGLAVARFETHRLRVEPRECLRQLAAIMDRQRVAVAAELHLLRSAK